MKKYSLYVRNWYRKKFKEEPWFMHLISSRSRCCAKKNKYYKRGIKNYLTKEQIKFLWFRDKAYLLKKPSIDRINNDGNYEIDNCRFIELSENSRLGNLGRKRKLGKYKKNVTKSALVMRAWRKNKRSKV